MTVDGIQGTETPGARAVVSDDGSAIRLIAYSGNGVAVPVELSPAQAIAVAIDLLQAARPKLQSVVAARHKKRRGGDPRSAKREQRDEALRELHKLTESAISAARLSCRLSGRRVSEDETLTGAVSEKYALPKREAHNAFFNQQRRSRLLRTVACAPIVWDKPGGTQAEFNVDNARCRMVARGLNSGEFYAAGSPNFVAAAALGNAIGTAANQRATYRDCMAMQGYTERGSSTISGDGPSDADLRANSCGDRPGSSSGGPGRETVIKCE